MRVVALDTETTGFNRSRNGVVSDGHRVVEIGCVEIVNGVITGKTFHSYVNPCMSCDVKAVEVHGLTDRFLADKPVFGDVAHDFIKFISGAELVIIHNAGFDISFIDKEFSLLRCSLRPFETFRFFDTLLYSRGIFPGMRNGLNDLSSRLNLKGRATVRHGALEDAFILAQIYIRLI